MPHSVSPSASNAQKRLPDPEYRNVKPLPVQLLDHCTVCLEEHLFSSAFALLTSTLASGTSYPGASAYIPPAQHIALASTSIVHPQLTTRTHCPDKHAASEDALRYLRHLHSLVSPKDAGVSEAYQFINGSSSTRSKRTRQRHPDAASNDQDDPSHIRLPYADKESLWSTADDFWSVVGWAFNCSIVHPHRWERWQLWLDLMLDVLEADLEQRLPDATAAYQRGGVAAVASTLRDSLFAQYLSPIGEGRNPKRRLMRAIFADGSSKSLAEFPEIWRHETKSPKPKRDERMSKKRKLDVENGDFGDYLDNPSDDDRSLETSSIRRSRSTTALPSRQASSSSDLSAEEEEEEDQATTTTTKTPSTTSKPSPATPSNTNPPTSATTNPLHPSLSHRHRLLHLLLHLTTLSPQTFLSTEDTLDLLTEFLRPLPLTSFTSYLLPSKPYLPPPLASALLQMVLRPLLSRAAPIYSEGTVVSAEVLETWYAPFAAGGAGKRDNAKVSLCVEGLLRLVVRASASAISLGEGLPEGRKESLRRAVEKGILAREERVALGEQSARKKSTRGSGRARQVEEEEEEAGQWLICSGMRMRVVLDLLNGSI